nr:DinB family protein [uncultured Bacillus sp.]
MGELLKNQFDIIRERLVKRLAEIPEEITSIQPVGFSNTIHWNLGHLLVITEKFVFGEEGQLPAHYSNCFAPGTKPADWKGNVPSMEELLEKAKEQLVRIKAIPNERFLEKLPKPMLGQTTVGELASFAIYHESYHFGQIHAMRRMIETSLNIAKS